MIDDWDPAFVRAEGDFVRLAGRWYPTRLRFDERLPTLDVLPESVGAGAPFRTETTRVEAAVSLMPECGYAGLRFWLRQLRDAAGAPVRSAVPVGSTGYRAVIWAVMEDQRAAMTLPGAEVLDPRASDGGVVLIVPVAALVDYRDVVAQTVFVRSGPDGAA
jgi:CBS domain-containing protein